ncbi:MAG: 4Fe-4S dicluster domain-containing protein [Clostridia bacterium]|nr:4Fe-4S dicluster domain-containing protein [Clostridia bacterium]
MNLPFIREAMSQLFSKPSTEMYPFVPKEAPENYRGRIVFHPENCVDCGMCEKVCAAGAITKAVLETEEGKVITRSFSLDSCTFCKNCADFCPRKAIELTKDYHMVSTNPEDFIVSGTYLKKAPVKPAPKPAAETPAE